MTDTRLLESLIEESGFKKSFIAKKLGLSTFGFLKKTRNESEFTASEIGILTNLICHNDFKLACKVFFCSPVEL